MAPVGLSRRSSTARKLTHQPLIVSKSLGSTHNDGPSNRPGCSGSDLDGLSNKVCTSGSVQTRVSEPSRFPNDVSQHHRGQEFPSNGHSLENRLQQEIPRHVQESSKMVHEMEEQVFSQDTDSNEIKVSLRHVVELNSSGNFAELRKRLSRTPSSRVSLSNYFLLKACLCNLNLLLSCS